MAIFRGLVPRIFWGSPIDKVLKIGYPFDDPIAFGDPREGSEWIQGASGVEDAWIQGEDQILQGVLRWIPQAVTTNPVATGWDDVNGVRDWLSSARSKVPFLVGVDARDYLTAGMLTQTGLISFSAASLVDDNTGTNGFHTDTSVPGATLFIDLGVGVTKKFQSVMLFAATGVSNSSWNIDYSDNGASYTTAVAGWHPNVQGWNYATWGDVGAHRYWRLELANTPGGGTYMNEVKFSEGRTYKMYLVDPMTGGVEREPDGRRRIALTMRTANSVVVEGF